MTLLVERLSDHPGRSLLTPLDEWLKEKAVPRVPAWCTSVHLTLASIPISLAIVGACALARQSNAWLWLVSLLIALQWVTDTLDGAVGRARKEGLIRWGFYMDHFLDYVFVCSLVLGYALIVPGMAAYFVAIAAVIAGFMVNSFLLAAISDEFKIAFYGLGPTEARVVFIVTNSFVAISGPLAVPTALPWILGIGLLLLVGFVYRLQRRLLELDHAASRSATTGTALDRKTDAAPPRKFTSMSVASGSRAGRSGTGEWFFSIGRAWR